MRSLDNKAVYASIDFGTNTFHVLIAMLDGGSDLKYIDNKRWFVFLDRSNDNAITDMAYQKAIEVSQDISNYLEKFDLKAIYAVGTEVFRNKSNGKQLLNDMSNLIGETIELIDGKREAELVFTGVNELIDPIFKNYHLIDIGGGSTEFIRVHEHQKIWDQSYRIGLSVIKQHLNFEFEMTKSQAKMLDVFLSESLKDGHLFESRLFDTLILNGGSAELFHKVLPFNELNDYTQVYASESVLDLCEEWVFSSYEQRKSSHWIPDKRMEQMPLYLAKVSSIIKRLKVSKVVYTSASIKEGLILCKK